jgi:hypothetical protein
VASFFGIWGIQLFEKLRNDWVKSDCNGEDQFKNELAYDDFMLPKILRSGIMHCYCK